MRQADAYLAAIDGMIFGDSAAQGLVRGRAFLHAELGFSFVVPEGFSLNNTARAVQARGPDGATLIIEGGRDRGGDLRAFVTREWAPALHQPGQSRLRLGRVRSLSINGLDAAQVRATRRFRGRNQVLVLTAIRLDETIYRFTATSRRGEDAAQDAMAEAVASFGRLAPEDSPALNPYMLVRYQIAAGDTLQTLFMDAPADMENAAWFAVLNGLEPGEMPAIGTWVKLIRG